MFFSQRPFAEAEDGTRHNFTRCAPHREACVSDVFFCDPTEHWHSCRASHIAAAGHPHRPLLRCTRFARQVGLYRLSRHLLILRRPRLRRPRPKSYSYWLVYYLCYVPDIDDHSHIGTEWQGDYLMLPKVNTLKRGFKMLCQ